MTISSVVLHKGEEPPISGTNGSGTVFFSGCTLGCLFCQNHQISRAQTGREVGHDEFVGLLLRLQDEGAHNINLVTGTHFIPGIVSGLIEARAKGLRIPAVWNSGGFESDAGLDLLADHIDIYLPDIKCLDSDTALRLFSAPMYADAVLPAVRRMIRPAEYDENGMMKSGTIIRHLVLPGFMDNTRRVLKVFSEEFRDRALLSMMVQYLPPQDDRLCSALPDRLKDRNGKLTADEYDTLIAWLEEFGIEEGFVQEPEDDSGWLPDFERDNPFPENYSRVIRYWRD